MANIISVDPGSSFIKASNGKRSVRFPSVAIVAPSEQAGQIVVGNMPYVVGEEALLQQGKPRNEPHSGEEYHGSDLQHVLICEALRRLGNGSYDTMLVGLPYFLRHDTQARDRIKQRMRTFSWRDDSEHTSNIENVFIVPQGGGALWGWLADHRKESLGLVCAIDIGGHTTDVFTLAAGGSLDDDQEVQGASGSVGVNVHAFYQSLVARLRRMPGTGLHEKTFSYYTVMRSVEDKRMTLRHNGREIDISQPYAETCSEFTEHLLRAAQDTVGDRWSELDRIILTGGGAALIDHNVWHDNRIVNLDANSNVVGQMKFFTEAKAAESAA